MNGTNRAVWQHRCKERATEILVVRHTVVLRIYMLAYLILSFSTVFLFLSTYIEKGKSEWVVITMLHIIQGKRE